MSSARRAELDAEITVFGELLAGHTFVPRPSQNESLLGDYTAALDAYEEAKRVLDASRTEQEACSAVRHVLARGREALARVDSLRDRGTAQSLLCFFDSKHGQAETRVAWAPPGGASRSVDVCATDAARLQKERRKRAAHNRIPYWETWLEPLSSCREFHTSISGEGWDVIRYAGGKAAARVIHGGRRRGMVVNRLDHQRRPVQELFRAHRPAFPGAFMSLPAKPTWLAVWCDSPWTIETGPERAEPAT
ncbi:hypothetical protein AAIB46_26000 [Streptomyces sp. 35M1]|uniref:hypothetical protein n=1 Tax=Streptomyces sp. 35M1 TaxID=3142978 RepID=UPI003990AA31